MPEKPDRASGYPSGQLEKIRQTCLYVATKLGDLADELRVDGERRGRVGQLGVEGQQRIHPHPGRRLGPMLEDEGLVPAIQRRLGAGLSNGRLGRHQVPPDVVDEGSRLLGRQHP